MRSGTRGGALFRAALIGVALGWLCVSSFPAAAGEATTAVQVGQAIALRRARVAEFRVIKEAAEDLGLRVWLFGGTAAGFAHYVRWDLAREAGDPRYRQSFFDYDFTNIYRSTQDADLVVDGTPEQAEQLEGLIKQKMSFLQGSKDHWEVRLLRSPRKVGEQVKLPLLANPDFLEQHTDSNSTGMIELTDPPAGESAVRDLRDWESPLPFFLKDVTEGRLHYYRSPTHERTSRFRSGDNPPLFSVIRYLVKAFQYDLRIEGEDLQEVRAIIDAFDPRLDYPALSPWARGWLERYGPNLIRHAVNVEYAWNTLEGLGLREKLISLSSPSREGALGWWLSREPLRTAPLGNGGGRTAAELGIDTVAHETVDFLAYESITRDTTLRPNVLISRPGHPGEAASFGSGFYTLRGRTGARGTGLTIRFRVTPSAREGSDFTLHGGVVLVLNRAALQVIPDSLEASLLQYFQMLRDGVVDGSDRGAWMKLSRRLLLRPVSPEEEQEVAELVSRELKRTKAPGPIYALLKEWFALPLSPAYPELMEKVLRMDRGCMAASEGLSWPGWAVHPELVEWLFRRGDCEDFIPEHLFSKGQWAEKAPWLQQRIETLRLPVGEIYPLRRMAQLLAHPMWKDHPELVLALIDRVGRMEVAPSQLLQPLLRQPQWQGHPELVRRMMSHPTTLGQVFQVLSEPGWADHPKLLLEFAAVVDRHWGRPGYWDEPIDHLLGMEAWRHQPWLRKLCHGEQPTVRRLREAAVERARRQAGESASALTRLSGPLSSEECR